MISDETNGGGRKRKPPSSSSLTGKVSVLSMMMLVTVGSILFAAPSSAMAQQQQQQQQQTTGTAETTTGQTGPLTPDEREEQNRLQNVTAAITQNLQQGEIQVNGIVYTPRWSNPVWVQPNSLSVLFEYCLPGEFADSGQQILGSNDLHVLESYSVALSPVLTGWLMVVENEHQTERIPAAVGAICASDANDPNTRILTEQEQTVIKNIVQQFITIRNIQKTNITQVINIINNITTNQTGGGGGGNNQTDGGNQTNGGGNQTSPLTVVLTRDIGDGTDAPALWSLEAAAHGGEPPYTYSWDFGDGTTGEGCCPDHWYETPGEYVATATTTDAAGNTASDSVRIRVDIPIGLSVVLTADLIEGPEAPATYSLTVLMHDPISNRSEADYTYHWHFGDGETSDTTSRTTTHTYENPGVYYPQVTVTDPEGNTARNDEENPLRIGVPARSFEVEITRDIQDGTEAPSTWCFEPAFVTGAEGVPPYYITWDFGDGTTSSDREVCHTFEQPGDYEVTLDVRDSAGGEASASTTIRVLPPLETTTPITNETGTETEQPTTTEGETTPETPPATTEGETTTTPETPTTTDEEEGAGAAEEPPAGTTTEEEGATTTTTTTTPP